MSLLPILGGVGLLAFLAISSSSTTSAEGGGKRVDSGGGGGGGGGGGSPPDAYVPTAAEIKSAQQCLALQGFLTASDVDGKIGPKTTAALKAFQAKYKLKDQSGALTKETADLVCDAGSPIGDLIKGGMTKEAANHFFVTGRSAGIRAATDGRPQDPAPYYGEAGASTGEQQYAFKQGFDVGYLETVKGMEPGTASDAAGKAGDVASDAAGKVSDVLGGVFGNARPGYRPAARVSRSGAILPRPVRYDAQGRPYLG